MKKKLILLVVLIFVFLSHPSKDYYTVDHLWHYSEDNIDYDITYVENTVDQIIFEIKINTLDDKKIPLYFKVNEYISFVEVDNVKYDKIRYQRYYGEILHSNNSFYIYCQLSEKGKKVNYNYVNLKIEGSVNMLIISEKMKRIHYIDVNLKKYF